MIDFCVSVGSDYCFHKQIKLIHRLTPEKIDVIASLMRQVAESNCHHLIDLRDFLVFGERRLRCVRLHRKINPRLT